MTKHQHNSYVVLRIIPKSIDINGLWNDLPPGIHDATIDEIEKRFATNDHRKQLFKGFIAAVAALQTAGCKTIFLDGSFISEKPKPGDFDACWETSGVAPDKLDPVLLDFSDGRKKQKEKYFGELFPASAPANPERQTFIEYFQIDKHSGKAKGIVRLKLLQKTGTI